MAWAYQLGKEERTKDKILAAIGAAAEQGRSYVNSKHIEQLSPIPILFRPLFLLTLSPGVVAVVQPTPGEPLLDMMWTQRPDPDGEGFDIERPKPCEACLKWFRADKEKCPHHALPPSKPVTK